MMPEISLNILDVAQNSITAGASLIQILVTADTNGDCLTVIIQDDGCGMTKEQVESITDPFYTTRTTRKVGLGIPFFKYAAIATGGSFHIESTVSVGTTITATFALSHIDRMPLGDMTSTIHTLIIMNTRIDFLYTYTVDKSSFTLDTREFRTILGGLSFDLPEISLYIKEYLSDNKKEVDHGLVL